jgi:hypothetical protein
MILAGGAQRCAPPFHRGYLARLDLADRPTAPSGRRRARIEEDVVIDLEVLRWTALHPVSIVLAVGAFTYAVLTLRRSEQRLRALRNDLLSVRAEQAFLPGPVPAPLVERSRPRPPHEQGRARARA